MICMLINKMNIKHKTDILLKNEQLTQKNALIHMTLLLLLLLLTTIIFVIVIVIYLPSINPD